MTPPAIGPMTGPRESTSPISPMTRPARCGPAARASRISTSGSSRPAPTPCSDRKAIRLPTFHARPAASDPARNTSRPTSHRRRPPKRSAAQVVNGIVAVTASRKPVDPGDGSTRGRPSWRAPSRSSPAAATPRPASRKSPTRRAWPSQRCTTTSPTRPRCSAMPSPPPRSRCWRNGSPLCSRCTIRPTTSARRWTRSRPTCCVCIVTNAPARCAGCSTRRSPRSPTPWRSSGSTARTVSPPRSPTGSPG